MILINIIIIIKFISNLNNYIKINIKYTNKNGYNNNSDRNGYTKYILF